MRYVWGKDDDFLFFINRKKNPSADLCLGCFSRCVFAASWQEEEEESEV